jgi:hypothetical protein
MKKTVILNTMLGSLLLSSAPAMATGFVTLPDTGVPVSGGTSAYETCNLTGDFGSNPNGSTPPTFSPSGGENNTCALPSITPPLAGYVKRANKTRNIIMNNVYTNNLPRTVGWVRDAVWRNGTSCIYGAKIRLNNIDYDRRAVSPGVQYFEINDLLRAGFAGRGPISVAYHYTTTGAGVSDEVVYRAGLTFTSVVHQPGDSAQPFTSLAPLSQNWVDFTSDVSFLDDDGSSVRDSPWLLVKGTCTTGVPVATPGALRFRQMGQEGQPLIEISVDGFAPAGANTAP